MYFRIETVHLFSGARVCEISVETRHSQFKWENTKVRMLTSSLNSAEYILDNNNINSSDLVPLVIRCFMQETGCLNWIRIVFLWINNQMSRSSCGETWEKDVLAETAARQHVIANCCFLPCSTCSVYKWGMETPCSNKGKTHNSVTYRPGILVILMCKDVSWNNTY